MINFDAADLSEWLSKVVMFLLTLSVIKDKFKFAVMENK